jgi:DNA mismatch repair protein MutL
MIPQTTGRVALLEASVAERIAAGEVIERPSSVVKELVENAIDAGSTRVWIDIREGGQAQIRISDDGCGMSREDATLAINRFATSKIRTWEDMEALQTLGFRGEALPSIVAVSRMELLTREHHAAVGTRLVARGADPVMVEEAGCPAGTTVTVSELFFNTPARRKFLKSGVAEAARIVDLLGRFSLLHTHIHFRLTSGDKEFFNFPHQYGLVERLKRLWHVDARGGLAEVARSEGEARLSGVVVCPPTFANARTRQVIYVNGRLVVNQALSQAITQGFDPLVPDRRFPMAVLFIEIPPGEVDVNVHPTKSEVRFLYPRALFKLVRDGVAEALTAAGAQPQDHVEAIARVASRLGEPASSRPAPVHDGALDPAFRAPTPDHRPHRAGAPSPGGTEHGQGAPRRERPLLEQVQAAIEAVAPLDDGAGPLDRAVPGPDPGPPANAPAQEPDPRAATAPRPEQEALFPPAEDVFVPSSEGQDGEARIDGELPSMPIPGPVARVAAPSGSRWQVLAQLHRTYIVCLKGDELWLVDQHTAHERVNYELLSHITDGSRQVASQPLLFPLMLELAADEAAALAGHLEVFEELGYSIEPFGGGTFVVRALPAGLKALSRPAVLRQIIAEVTQDERAREPHRLKELLRATSACRASVMAGDLLTREEMETLLARLEAVPRGGYCPHGRPVAIGLGEADLARLFHRR